MTSRAPTVTQDSVHVDGRERTFTVVSPPETSATADGAPPLVLVFHGSRQSAEKHRAFTGHQFDELASSAGATVVYLDGYRGNWNDGRRYNWSPARREGINDVKFTEAVVTRLSSGSSLSNRHVFAIGFSNGGQMVMRLAHEVPQLFAGVAVIGATMPTSDSFLVDETTPAPLPVLLVHGTKDPIAAYEGGPMSWWKRRVFKIGGETMPATATAAYFAARNDITERPTAEPLADPADPALVDGTHVTKTVYGEAGKLPVALYTIDGGGHAVPGRKAAPRVMGVTSKRVSTAELVRDFFEL